jgi:fatty acid desaturase
MAIGPLVGQIAFMVSDWRLIRAGDRRCCAAGLARPGVWRVLTLVVLSPMPVWAYLLSAYLGLSILKIRTFLEHQAHERASARTVIIEDRGPLAFLFLNNNLHVVHHMHPKLPWYRCRVSTSTTRKNTCAAMTDTDTQLCRDLREAPDAREGPGAASALPRAIGRLRGARAGRCSGPCPPGSSPRCLRPSCRTCGSCCSGI